MRVTLIVLRCADLERSVAFYAALGLTVTREQHGTGPVHFSCTLDHGVVLELYPRGGRDTSGLRLGLRVDDGIAGKGTVVTDPDGHQLELT